MIRFFIRRKLIGFAAALVTLSVNTGTLAQSFPSKPIRWIVVAPAGSSLDVIARSMQDKLRDTLGQPIVIENRPQAGGTLGAGEVAKVITTSQPNLIAVNSSLPVTNVAELVELMRKSPGKYNYASVGNGSSSHLTMEYLKALTGTFAVHIPFNGGPPAALSIVSGDTQILATVPTVIIPQVKAGRMKALAVTGKSRYSLAPELPTVAQSGIKELANFEALAWNGVLVAAGTPRATVDRINAAINAAMKDPAVQTRLQTAGLETVGGTPEDFAKLIRDEASKWAPIIQRSGAKLD
jgi:tripartite-type tricarboxylate transporter receptor subunit TctC